MQSCIVIYWEVELRIGFSLVDLALGGAQTFLVQLASGLNQRGHQVCCYLSADVHEPDHVFPALLAELKPIAHMVGNPRGLWDCDVIQLDGYHSLIRKLAYLPIWNRCVETYHSHYSARRSGPLYPPHRVAVSRQVAAALPKPVQVIYQGIPLPPTPEPGPRPYDVGILGRLHPVKGHLLFLYICEALFRQRGSLNALVIGGHPRPSSYQEQLDREIERLRNLGLSIHVTGDVAPEQVYSWLEKVRVSLVTSQSEGFGRMALEALACETPVVANPVDGLLEIIREGETGFFAERDNPQSFASLTLRLLDDESARERLGVQGRRVVAQNFTLDRMLDAYEDLYSRIEHRSPG